VTTPLEISKSYWDAECRRDLDAVMSYYHDDATYEDAGGLRRGHAEIRANYEEHIQAFPALNVAILREFPSGDSSAIEFEASLIAATGEHLLVRGVNVVDVRDGKFTSVRSYEDTPKPTCRM
jgi:ketosteroid isomerase-like protein